MQYAYIRVSSADQNTARQEEALLKAGFQPEKIYVEHASAKDTNRPSLAKMYRIVRFRTSKPLLSRHSGDF